MRIGYTGDRRSKPVRSSSLETCSHYNAPRQGCFELTDTTHHGYCQPLVLHCIELVHVSKKFRIRRKGIVAYQNRLSHLDEIDSIYEPFLSPLVVRERDIVPVCSRRSR